MNWLKKPSTFGGVIYLLVVAILMAGLVVVAFGEWRGGVTAMGLSFALAFVTRALLPEDRAGMLSVRRRYLDLTTLGICSGLLLVLAVVIPNRK